MIIGLAGSNGSGKDTIGHLLEEHFNYLFVSVTEILRKELFKRNKPITRENLRHLSAEWRRESEQLGVLVDKAVELFNKNTQKHKGLAIASLRNAGEADRVHELGGLVFWIDADPKIRYERIRLNAKARQRSEEDDVSYSKFLEDEAQEMTPPPNGDAATLNMQGVKNLCDYFIINQDKSLNELKKEINIILTSIK